MRRTQNALANHPLKFEQSHFVRYFHFNIKRRLNRNVWAQSKTQRVNAPLTLF